MLQKSKSKKAGMMKYLVVVPMVVLSMVIFSTTAMAQEKAKTANQVKKEKVLKEVKEYNQTATKEEKIKVLDENYLEEHLKERKEVTEVRDFSNANDPIPFAVLENPPRFKGCEEKSYSDAKECFMTAMNNHIKTNFTYPKEALDKDIQGRITILFDINKEGDIENLRMRGTGYEGSEFLEKEGERIIKSLPKFKPGMIEGKPVAVSYAQPIMFKLQKEEKPKPIEIKE